MCAKTTDSKNSFMFLILNYISLNMDVDGG